MMNKFHFIDRVCTANREYQALNVSFGELFNEIFINFEIKFLELSGNLIDIIRFFSIRLQ